MMLASMDLNCTAEMQSSLALLAETLPTHLFRSVLILRPYSSNWLTRIMGE